MTDIITLEFINPNGAQSPQSLTITNGVVVSGIASLAYVSLNFEKDFFTPSDACTIVFEDLDVTNFLLTVNIGWQVKISINNNLQMIGYIFKYDLNYNRGSGTKLSIEIKDLLSYMEYATCPPNVTAINPNNGQVQQSQNLHFDANTTLKTALQTIASIFFVNTFNGQGTNIDINNLIQIDDSSNLTLASGYKIGLAIKGTTPKARIKSIGESLNHLATPDKGESYLAYMIRLAKHAGCNIKMMYSANGISGQYIYVGPPIYDRQGLPYIYELSHSNTTNGGANPEKNNVLEAHYKFNLEDQPSVVIVEAGTMGDGKFYQSTLKGISLNELTAFGGYGSTTATDGQTVLNQNGVFPGTNTTTPLANYIQSLVSGTSGVGYVLSPYNNQLFGVFSSIPVRINGNVSMPFYTVSNSAHTPQECSFAASKILAEKQDKYMEFTYRVQGWTTEKIVWQPNTLVHIYDTVFNGRLNQFTMWIKRVNYLVSKTNGTTCELICTLPYTHNFEITN